MGDSPFMLSTTISVIYLLLRFIEMRFIVKETKPLKLLIRDALIVYLSTLSGFYILQNVSPITKSSTNTAAFINDPDF
tara:strand:- start:60 stop:293 length:234 start_codon:yes stop_codon:yes gene_type:complete